MNAVWVLGNASLDLSFNVARLPAPGETLMADGLARAPGGKGLNQAVVAVRAGVPTHFCAPLGPGPEAALIRAALAGEGFASLMLPEVAASTDLSILMVGRDGENCIVSTGACADTLSVEAARSFVAGMAAGDILLMQGNLSEQATRLAAVTARARGGRILLNTAPLRWDVAALLLSCDIVIANEGEAEAASGRADPTSAATWLLATGAASVIVTLGARGCLFHAPYGRTHHPALAVQAVDTTGAGDTFCGMLAARLAGGAALPAAIDAAQAAAALAVGRAGCFAALPSRAELVAL